MEKKYICECVEECGYTDQECLHSVEHFLVGDINGGCMCGNCTVMGRVVSCVGIRKFKLEKLGRSSLVEVGFNSEVE